MKKIALTFAAVLMASGAGSAFAQDFNAFSGPVVNEPAIDNPVGAPQTSEIETDTRFNTFEGPVAPTTEVMGMVDAPIAEPTGDNRFNEFSGPVVR